MWIHYILHTLSGIQLAALALAGGGIIALGAFSAPIFFKVMDRRPAGKAMTEMFARFDKFLAVLTWVILVTELPFVTMVAMAKFITFTDSPRWVAFMGIPETVKTVCVLTVIIWSLENLYGVNRKLAKLEPDIFQEGKIDRDKYKAFQALHKTSEKIAKIVAIAALLALFVSPFADI
jgi:hypothetical protein